MYIHKNIYIRASHYPRQLPLIYPWQIVIKFLSGADGTRWPGPDERNADTRATRCYEHTFPYVSSQLFHFPVRGNVLLPDGGYLVAHTWISRGNSVWTRVQRQGGEGNGSRTRIPRRSGHAGSQIFSHSRGTRSVYPRGVLTSRNAIGEELCVIDNYPIG